ncbi:serine protease [Deinococcus yavapaiensis KR-236]|uniref:Serine protease n=2 Tax=Deinococcus TaxID=1298 RepID=A0A318SLV0_9DEIO|nr:serine protease [Deinococcus yavapaiensis KR-236]
MLLAASLALTACGFLETPAETRVGEVTGNVVPDLVLSASQDTASVSASFGAPRVRGQVLILGASALRAQGLDALSGVRLEALGDDLARAFTPSGETDEAFAARLRASGVRAQPNYLYRALAASVPNDPGYPGNAGISFGATRVTQDYLTRINAKSGWDAAFDAGNPSLTSPIVAVLDTGVDASHPDLAGRLLAGRDFCATTLETNGDPGTASCSGEDADTSETTGDSSGHGTFAIGMIGAATNNGVGIAGLTWSGRTLLPVKVFNTSSVGEDFADTVSLTKGVAFAVSRGARIINMSVGFGGGNYDPALAQTLQSAYDANVVLVAASGNVAIEGVLYPASDPRVISVGSTVVNNQGAEVRSPNSAVPLADQRPVDLYAPGGDIQLQNQLLGLNLGGGYTRRAGTSFAAPQVSGAAALLLQKNPAFTPEQVRRVLTTSGRDIAGGAKLLDVGAAMRATAPSTAPYTVTVTARQGASVVQTFRKQTYDAVSRVPYSLTLPYGTYTLSASLSGNGLNLTGSRVFEVNAEEEFGTDITVR